jgi:hypothetical protein
LVLKKLVNGALEGDARSADLLFALRGRASRNSEVRFQKILVEDWLPDYPGQTGEQKTREHARENETDPAGSWEQAGSSPTDPDGSVSPIASPKASRDE